MLQQDIVIVSIASKHPTSEKEGRGAHSIDDHYLQLTHIYVTYKQISIQLQLGR